VLVPDNKRGDSLLDRAENALEDDVDLLVVRVPAPHNDLADVGKAALEGGSDPAEAVAELLARAERLNPPALPPTLTAREICALPESKGGNTRSRSHPVHSRPAGRGLRAS
jgi:hypothetical protein